MQDASPPGRDAGAGSHDDDDNGSESSRIIPRHSAAASSTDEHEQIVDGGSTPERIIASYGKEEDGAPEPAASVPPDRAHAGRASTAGQPPLTLAGQDDDDGSNSANAGQVGATDITEPTANPPKEKQPSVRNGSTGAGAIDASGVLDGQGGPAARAPNESTSQRDAIGHNQTIAMNESANVSSGAVGETETPNSRPHVDGSSSAASGQTPRSMDDTNRSTRDSAGWGTFMLVKLHGTFAWAAAARDPATVAATVGAAVAGLALACSIWCGCGCCHGPTQVRGDASIQAVAGRNGSDGGSGSKDRDERALGGDSQGGRGDGGQLGDEGTSTSGGVAYGPREPGRGSAHGLGGGAEAHEDVKVSGGAGPSCSVGEQEARKLADGAGLEWNEEGRAVMRELGLL